jgi:hypothetical protein
MARGPREGGRGVGFIQEMGGLEGGIENPSVSRREVGGKDNGKRLGNGSFFVGNRSKKTAPCQKKKSSEKDERKNFRTFL